MSTFGQRIRELRKSKDYSLRKLAPLVGVGFTYLSKVERGKLHCDDCVVPRNKKRGPENLRPAFVNFCLRQGGKISICRVNLTTRLTLSYYRPQPQPVAAGAAAPQPQPVEAAGVPHPQPDEAAGAADEPQPHPPDAPPPETPLPLAEASLHGLKVYGTNFGTILQTWTWTSFIDGTWT